MEDEDWLFKRSAMKADFIFIIFMFGTFICATYAAPTIKHSATSKELLLNQNVKTQKEGEGEPDVNHLSAVAEVWGTVGRVVSKVVKEGAKGALGGMISAGLGGSATKEKMQMGQGDGVPLPTYPFVDRVSGDGPGAPQPSKTLIGSGKSPMPDDHAVVKFLQKIFN